jgi:hypothetical protein
MNPNVVVILASLDQKHAFSRILSQALSQHAACATSADDDVVVCFDWRGLSHVSFVCRSLFFIPIIYHIALYEEIRHLSRIP